MELSAHRKILQALVFTTCIIGGSQTWAAKDLSGRFGLGVADVGPRQTPAISVDWQASRASSFEFNMTLDTTKNDNLLVLGTRYSRNLYIEDQQFYFMYLGAALISQQSSGKNRSGYKLESGAGAKSFLTGIPNLGFTMRGGFELKSNDDIIFRTAVHFGIHYYF